MSDYCTCPISICSKCNRRVQTPNQRYLHRKKELKLCIRCPNKAIENRKSCKKCLKRAREYAQSRRQSLKTTKP